MDHSKFTNQYSLSKTLRFELKPVGETADYIEDFGSEHLKSIVLGDQKRADDYIEIKNLIDDLHRSYINKRLGCDTDSSSLGHPRNVETGEEVISAQELEDAFVTYKATKKKFEGEKGIKEKADALENWEDKQVTLRKQLVKAFSDKNLLFGKELIKQELPEFLKKNGNWEEHQKLIESFNKFTTYFTGFHENRKNMYVADDKATSIANRAINENLPRFFENILVFEKIANSEHSAILEQVKPLLTVFNGMTLAEVFSASAYLRLFSQRGIEAYLYLIGGKKTEDKNQDDIAGLNQLINQYRQEYNRANKDSDVTKLTNRNFPTLVSLHKQILANTTNQSYSYEPYETDEQLLTELAILRKEFDRENGFFHDLETTLESLTDTKPESVYIRSNALSQVSHNWLGHRTILKRAFEFSVENSDEYKTKSAKEKQIELLNDKSKTIELFSFQKIDEWLKVYFDSQDEEVNKPIKEALSKNGTTIAEYFSKSLDSAFKNQENPISELESKLDRLCSLNQLSKNRRAPNTNSEDDKGGEGFYQMQTIQQYLDSYLTALKSLKQLHLVHGRKGLELPDNQDKGFYNQFADLYELINDGLLNVFNKSRNYLTKKPYSNEKIKINFENANLMSGWDANKETDNSCVLFEKEGLYYLGVMHHKHRGLFDYIVGIDELEKQKTVEKKKALEEECRAEQASYRKIVYKLLPGANKMLPKVFFSKSRIDFFAPSDEVLRIRNTASHSKGGLPQKGHTKADFDLKDCHALIDFFKDSIEKHYEWRQYNFEWSPTDHYNDISQFYKELQDQAYKIEFHSINDSYIEKCISEGKLFLFQIYNKDFSPHSKGTPNLHTMYWRGLFEPENLKDVVLKLNGEAEMFFRPHSIKRKNAIVHEANKPIERKNGTKGGKSVFSYDIVKDKRYTKDKFFLHVPITLNHKAPETLPRFNDAINKAINEKTTIFALDRGERHLLYYALINQHGEIIKDKNGKSIQGSYNLIKPSGNSAPVDYHRILSEKEKQRDAARKSWSTIENIKDLKAGYLSQVVHQICQLVIEHNAIICLEDLNFGFKRGRFKIEKQVYQKFEKALIDKLNYLVNKQEKEHSKPGHYLNAIQLTDKFKSFEKLGKQSGILYYVTADYTSKICPLTGFIDLLKPYYRNRENCRTFFSNFESIIYNGTEFECTFDYKKTNPGADLKGSRTKWIAISKGERIVNKKDQNGKWSSERIKPSIVLENAFFDNNISLQKNVNLINTIIKQDNTKFFKPLIWGLRLTLQMRNSVIGSTKDEDDYIISPVADENGRFYDSREVSPTDSLPKNADANGAYHIALKGLWNIQQIKEVDWEQEKPKLPKLIMSNTKWFEFVQNKTYQK